MGLLSTTKSTYLPTLPLLRAICLGGPWVVGDRWPWCPVSLPGAGGPRGRGVRIVQMLCRSRASRKRRAALWCHRQCSWSRSSGVWAPMWTIRWVATYRHRLGGSMVGGGECCPSRWSKMTSAMAC